MPASAVGDRESEQSKGAAVEIFRRSKPIKNFGKPQESRGRGCLQQNLIYADMAE